MRTSVFVLFAIIVCGCYGQGQDAAKPSLMKWGAVTSINNAQKLKDAGYSFADLRVSDLLVPQESEQVFQKNLKKAKSADFPICSFNGLLPSDIPCVGPEVNNAALVDYVRIACERSQKAGVKMIVFGSGKARNIPEGFTKEQARKQIVELLGQIAPIAAKNNVIVLIEALNKTETNFINTVAEATDIAKEINHPNICIVADFYHMAMENESPDSIREAGALVKHCHIAEKTNRQAPGTTDYDFTPYFKAIKDIGYDGGVSIECRWKDFDGQIVGAIKTMQAQWDKTN